MKMFNDILDLTKKSKKYNLHSHTEFCDGRATMEAFARKAVEEGFLIYGFTPHSPIPFISSCNMLKDNVGRFAEECERIKKQYPQTLFLKGMEIDYLGTQWGPSTSFFSDLGLDYSIGSVHFIQNKKKEWIDIDGSNESFAVKLHKDFNNDLDYIIKSFFGQSMEMVIKGGFNIIGHFDKIADNASFVSPGIEDTQEFISQVENLIAEIKKAGLTAEINTKKVDAKKRFFPHTRYWKVLIDNEIPIVVNSDAHVPALINAGRDEAFSILNNI